MKDFLNQLVNNDLTQAEINTLKLGLSETELDEANNISFLQNFIEKSDFAEPMNPDTAKAGIINYLFNNRIIVSSSGVMLAIIISSFLFFTSQNRSQNNSEDLLKIEIAEPEIASINASKHNVNIDSKGTINSIYLSSTSNSANEQKHNVKSLASNSIEKSMPSRTSSNSKNLNIIKPQSLANNAQTKIEDIATSTIPKRQNRFAISDLEQYDSKFNESLISPINPSPYSKSKNLSLAVRKLSPVGDSPINQDLKLQNFNNIDISLIYKIKKYRLGLSLRRENFDLNYTQKDGSNTIVISEFPNLTSGLVSFGYELELSESTKPFVNVEYGLNRRGQIFGVGAGLRYYFSKQVGLTLSVDQGNLLTFENQYANKLMISYGVSYNF